MAYVPNSGSVVAFQSDPTKLVGTFSVVGTLPVVLNNSSIITVQQGSVAAVIIGGSIAASFTPPANQSVSGTIGASIIGTVPVTGFPTNPSISGTVLVNNGSVIAFQGGAWTTSVVGTVFVAGSIATVGTAVANQSVSGTVGASIIGLPPVNVTNFPTTQNVSGSVVAFQGTSPWVVNSQNSSIIAISTGSVIAIPTGNQSISGTVTVGSMLAIPAIVSTANSTTSPVTSTLSFTGTGEEWKDFATITVNVFTDAVSATNGLSIQQSSDNSNWDITDTYTVPSMIAGQGKTFGLQPAARFGRVVYTQGAQNSGAFRLQTIYHPQYTKPSSQRPGDGYTNETDLEQQQAFNMVYDDTSNTWYRMRGRSSIGTLVYTTSSIVALVTGNPSVSGTVGASIIGQLPGGTATLGSVVAYQGTSPWLQTFSNSSIIAINAGSVVAIPSGSVITIFGQSPSIVGTYAEDAPATSGDKGFLVMGARNDTLSSVTSNDGDYSSHVVGPAGELIAANSPFTKWVSGTGSMLGGTPVTGSLVPIIAAQGASIFTYITGVQIANASGTNAWITLLGATNSVIGFTVAPANGGSNIYYQNGLKTNANAAFSASISAVASVYVSAQGFIAKI